MFLLFTVSSLITQSISKFAAYVEGERLCKFIVEYQGKFTSRSYAKEHGTAEHAAGKVAFFQELKKSAWSEKQFGTVYYAAAKTLG